MVQPFALLGFAVPPWWHSKVCLSVRQGQTLGAAFFILALSGNLTLGPINPSTMRCMPSEMYAREMYAREMHARKMHTRKIHASEMHAHQVHAHETHAHQMHAHEINAHRSVAFPLGKKCQRTLSGTWA